ncbi:DUF397 domain-containing protein [Nonomuraea sp. NPDC050663]|uniref:DUF397 domain-containing protein n=1 Tax=Nonomuraea sp. NPDC050663 TaxID=3364370 RepID=UPI0037B391DB
MKRIVSADGWVRYSNSQGNCVEARIDPWNGSRVRVRESTAPDHDVAVSVTDWDVWLARVSDGTYEPEDLGDQSERCRITIPLTLAEHQRCAGRPRMVITSWTSWRAFQRGVQAGLFAAARLTRDNW